MNVFLFYYYNYCSFFYYDLVVDINNRFSECTALSRVHYAVGRPNKTISSHINLTYYNQNVFAIATINIYYQISI